MNKKKKIVILSILAVLIIVVMVLGISSAFIQAGDETGSTTAVSLSSCATITLDGENSIDLTNSSPISRNVALNNTPYTFTVTSYCEDDVTVALYIATLSSNTLADSNIYYIITTNGSKTDVLAEGKLSSATTATFTDAEVAELQVGIGGEQSAIYQVYSKSISSQGSATYDLYLYVDSDISSDSTMGKTFNAGLVVKGVD